jgi:alpha-ketoglutaric semialdehyde dehydrogenase
MKLHGCNFIGGELSQAGSTKFHAFNAVSGETLAPNFTEATAEEIDRALSLADRDFEHYRSQSPEAIATFLDRIAEEILKLGDELLQRANLETALPEQRLVGERGRTVGQIKMFADLIREGSWVEASIDRAIPDRKPLPKLDMRRMLIPLGPVVVFGASNFPLAFSVAGGDTVSALAAGNPVVVKAHPAHPGTSELVASAIIAAAKATGMPAGTFSMVHGSSNEVGLRLARHPAAKAIGFTGSLRGGRALFDAAATRPEPIPVYAEMGSTNPVFVLPGALSQKGAAIAEGLVQSVTMGVGQFCTNPGLVFTLRDPSLEAFSDKIAELITKTSAGTMLHQGICKQFQAALQAAEKVSGVRVIAKSNHDCSDQTKAPAAVLSTDADTFRQNAILRDEIFGPSTVVVTCDSESELEQIAREMGGQLTATIHGTAEDLSRHSRLVTLLQQNVGRLLFNGFPTGVEVCPSMHHGGPYPATTDSRSTSVGTAAIKRFARPICFQNFPDAALPVELQNKNGRNIWRLVDNQLTKNDC